jgi:Holliday junction resolvasome RuvABC ATP-dependent DNA helicase subunit
VFTYKQYAYEPKLRLTCTEEQVIESLETVLLLGRSGTGKTICIANKMQADRRVAPGTSQLFVARSRRICHLVASLQGSGVQAQDSLNMHSLTTSVSCSKCIVLGLEAVYRAWS